MELNFLYDAMPFEVVGVLLDTPFIFVFGYFVCGYV